MIAMLKQGGRLWLPVIFLALIVLAGCPGRTVQPAPFEMPIESRLILQVPYFSSEGLTQAAALASVMTFNGRPHSPEEIKRSLGEGALKPKTMVVFARQAELKAEFYNGAPEGLIEAVRANKPLMVRMGASAGPLSAGDYAVVVGYTPTGVVVNSGVVNQQIVDWGAFLSGWLAANNLTIAIEPL